jgi:hypothetical protein
MKKVNVKEIREQCEKMSAGLAQAPSVEFNGYTKSDLDTDLAEAANLDMEIAQEEAALKAKKDRRDNKYRGAATKRVKIGKGIAGHKEYGEDSELYGACGFIRKSERKSGLHRGKKTDGDSSK